MFKKLRERLTFANIVALIALFVALGGTVYAANKINGKNIKKNSIPGNRIKKGTLTGTQVKSSTLGTVPSATNASNAATLNGQPSSAFLASNGVRADGEAISKPIDNFTTASYTDIVAKSFTAPSAGVVFVTGSVATEADNSLAEEGELQFRLTVDGTAVSQNNNFAHSISTNTKVNMEDNSGTTSIVTPISAGSHTVALQARETGGGDFIEGREVSAIFVPNGSGPSIPLP